MIEYASTSRPFCVLRIAIGFVVLLCSACTFASALEERKGQILDEDSFLDRTRQLIFTGRRSGEGYFSPNGDSIVFQSERIAENPFFQIFLLDLNTGNTRLVSTGEGKTTCAFIHPDNSKILFASTHHDLNTRDIQKAELEFRLSGQERRYEWDFDAQMDIYVVENEAGAVPKRVTDAPGYDAEGSYSPDGKWVVFTSLRDGWTRELDARERKLREVDPSFFGEIWVMRADGSDAQRLTHTPGYDGGPFFTADGSKIVWRRFNEDGLVADVWTMNPDGSGKTRITDFGSMSWAPYPHPSGEYVFFSSNKLGFENFEVFIVDIEGTREPVRVTYTDGFDGLPVPSPDGNKLTWTSTRHGGDGAQIYIADWNHAAALHALDLSPLRKPINDQLADDDHVSIKQHVLRLTAPDMEGRLTGQEGERRAADYISEQLGKLGAESLPGHNQFTFDFEFTAGSRDTGSRIEVRKGETPLKFNGGEHVRALGFSDSGPIEGPVVFAGYGIRVPDSAEFGYDSYATLDVKDKIVMVLRYVPEDTEGEVRSALNRHSGLRYKAMTAREAGARGLLVVTGPRSPNAGKTIPMRFDSAAAGSGIHAASVSDVVATAILSHTGRSLEEIQQSFDDGNPHVSGFAIPGVELVLNTSLERQRKLGTNVVAALPATNEDGPADSWVVLGAHYDHLGSGSGGNSLAREGEEGKLHPGADDNASGVAAVLQVAAELVGTPRSRNIALAFWSGEELGLLGSANFVDRELLPNEAITAYVNLDMVGRVRENRLVLQGLGSSPDWGEMIEPANVLVGFNLNLQADPYLPTDSASFYNVGIPTVNVFSGAHEDYHRPTDVAEKLNFEDLERVAQLAELLTQRLASRSEPMEFAQVQRELQAGGSRDTVRAYTGTVPDYASETEGLLLSNVIQGGPASVAGLRGGDVIVEFGGRVITNIYDYTYALDDVKVGEPVEVVFVREGTRHEVVLIPTARP